MKTTIRAKTENQKIMGLGPLRTYISNYNTINNSSDDSSSRTYDWLSCSRPVIQSTGLC